MAADTSHLTNSHTSTLRPTGLLRVLLLSLAVGVQALTPSHYLSRSDVARLQTFLGQHFTDLESAYYSVVGLAKLGASVEDQAVSGGGGAVIIIITIIILIIIIIIPEAGVLLNPTADNVYTTNDDAFGFSFLRVCRRHASS